MKTTQVEFLKSLSTNETMDAFIARERAKRISEIGTPNTESKLLQKEIIAQLTASEEARGFVAGFHYATLDALAKAETDMDAKMAIVSLITQSFAIGFAYAASLIDSSAESVVN